MNVTPAGAAAVICGRPAADRLELAAGDGFGTLDGWGRARQVSLSKGGCCDSDQSAPGQVRLAGVRPLTPVLEAWVAVSKEIGALIGQVGRPPASSSARRADTPERAG